jgi:uncharacterized protein YcfJ
MRSSKNKLAVLVAVSVAATLPVWSNQAQAATIYEEAEVLSSTPSRECWEEEVVRDARTYDRQRSATPGILGAVIGGALGNAVGHNKRNKQVGTVVGAILGGSIAGDISRTNANRQDVQYVDFVERCRTVHNVSQEEKLIGYDVSYSYNGSQHTVRLPEDPGNTVRVRIDIEAVQ